MATETETVDPVAESSFIYLADEDDTADWEIIRRGDEGSSITKLVKLYNEALTQTDVLRAMDHIVENVTEQGPIRPPPTSEQANKDKEQKEQLGKIRDLIKSLCHDKTSPGKNFATPPPTQFLHRREAPATWEAKPPTPPTGEKWAYDPRVISDDDGWKFNGYPGTYTPTVEDAKKNTYFWSLADLLGLFFAKLGPAPPDATALNFFLPITALYVRWTKILMPNQLTSLKSKEVVKMHPPDPTIPDPNNPPKDAVGTSPKAPFMYQCTWTNIETGKGHNVNFALGGSINGHHDMLKATMLGYDHSYKRFLLLSNFADAEGLKEFEVKKQNLKGGIITETVGWAFENAIEEHKFGNCAETYPFIQFLMKSSEPASVKGFSLMTAAVNKTSNYNSSNILKRKEITFEDHKVNKLKFIAAPCSNCQLLVDTAKPEISGEFSPDAVFPEKKPSAP
ncbi:hypothetical protein F4803DRAFT_364543 [Xylaria telfairii]|nr:hypothetical protein F4803DRAFT_364543 [Xylaria telfairii]